MSAGETAESLVSRDIVLLAPKFRDAVESAIAECNAAGLDAYIYEAYRSQQLQTMYYARGRTTVPPTYTVTNAHSNLYSWHGYGLAVDVISRSRGWNVPHSWFEQVAECFIRHGCKWGGHWKSADLPHFQWGKCKPSPSPLARQIIAAEGVVGVWRVVGAD